MKSNVLTLELGDTARPLIEYMKTSTKNKPVSVGTEQGTELYRGTIKSIPDRLYNLTLIKIGYFYPDGVDRLIIKPKEN